MAYVSPGGAFASSIEDTLMQRAAQKRADLEMSLALKREERMAKAQLEDEAERKRTHLEHEQETRDKIAETKTAATEKAHTAEVTEFEKWRNETVGPGDIVPGERLKQAIRLGYGNIAKPGVQASIPAATMTGQPAGGPPAETMQGPATNKGTPQQQVVQTMGSLKPGSPEWLQKAVELETLGKPISAGVLKLAEGPQQGGGTVASMRQNPRGQGPPQRMIDGRWVDWTGDVPKDAHWETQQPPVQPRDTSAKDARAASHRDQVYEKEKGSLDKLTSEAENHLKGISDLGLALNEMTPQADTLVAPLVLKATISGTGSGFRMTRAEIENVVGGRSAWENLNAELMHWSTDPSKALSITTDQRAQLRSLAKAIRKKARGTIEKANKYRDQMVEANDPKDIERLGNKAHQSLFVDDESNDTLAPPKKLTPAEARERFKY